MTKIVLSKITNQEASVAQIRKRVREFRQNNLLPNFIILKINVVLDFRKKKTS